MSKIDFDLAVEKLDKYIQTKNVHGVNGIKEKMLEICQMEFENAEDQQDFANICANFEKYCLVTKTTSFGRKQFEALFEQGFEFPDSMEAALKMLEPQEDPLPEAFYEDEKERIAHLEKRVEELTIEVNDYRDIRAVVLKIKEMLEPWA